MVNDDVLNGVNYDQYSNIVSMDDLGANTKIIFSEECYNKILSLKSKTDNSNRESGVFFVGSKSKENPLIIYIDSFTSDFDVADAYASGGAVVANDDNYSKLVQLMSPYRENDCMPVVIHFHAHSRVAYYEAMADQDYLTYASMQYDYPYADVFGMLAFAVPNSTNSFGLSVVKPTDCEIEVEENKEEEKIRKIKANFYMFPDLYYCQGNNIIKIGQFNKFYSNRKFVGTNDFSPVKNKCNFNGSRQVCCLGINPLTGLKMEDEVVGYIDVNDTFCFRYEKAQYTFPKPEEKTVSRVH